MPTRKQVQPVLLVILVALTLYLAPVLAFKQSRLTFFATLGSRKAMFELAQYLYLHDKDSEHWLAWANKSADRGYVPAMERLGQTYDSRFDPASGQGRRALYWYTKAAEQDSWIAHLKLAEAYTYGYWGLAKDPAKGAVHYARAEEIRHRLGIDQIR